jgi:FkbM family methyltransferase
MVAKSFLKSCARLCGYEVRRVTRPAATDAVPVACQPRSREEYGGARSDPFEDQRRLLRGARNPVILDVGAHYGETTQQYDSLFPEATIYSFEPFPESMALLRDRVAGLERVTAVAAAIADKPGRRTFYVNHYDATNSLLPRPTSFRRYYPEEGRTKATVDVAVTSIDRFMQERGIPRVDILKLDIQGGERMALEGARNALANRRISIVYTELLFVPLYEGAAPAHEICRFLEEFDYTLYNVYGLYSATNGQLRFGDGLFVSDRVRSAVIDAFPEEP